MIQNIMEQRANNGMVCKVACNSVLNYEIRSQHSHGRMVWIICRFIAQRFHTRSGLLALRMPYILEAGNLAVDEGDPGE